MNGEPPHAGREHAGREHAERQRPERPGIEPRSVVVRPARPVDAAAISRLDGLSASTRRVLERDLERATDAHAEVVALVAEVATDHLDARVAGDGGASSDTGSAPTDHLDARVADGTTAGTTDVVGAALGQVLLDEGHVLDLAVDPAQRGRAIGRLLLAALLAALDDRGARAHTLEVRPSNLAALALYRAAGFVVEGRRPRYYPDGEDALLLWRHDQRRRG